MSDVLIVKFDLDPEVSYYMDCEGVTLNCALNNLEKEFEEAVTTDLEIIDRDDLENYGEKGRDYIVIKNVRQLEKYDYELDYVLNQLGIDIKELKKLGVYVGDYDMDDDED
jgi:hypothetical protein